MKNFKLKSVEYKNTMSVGNELIKIDLSSHHKTLITGKNGGGKSTILEAITFALFGKPYRDILKAQLINSETKKNQWVKLVLEYDKSEYIIIRGQKPTVFEVTKNGEPLVAAASVKDFQTELEQMLGLNYNSFKQLVVLGTAGYTPFMGLKKPERRKLIEDLLEITILADMDKLNKDHLKDILANIKKCDIELSHIRTQISTHEDYQEKQKKMSGDNVSRLESMYDDIVKEVNSIKDKNIQLKEHILSLGTPEDVSDDLDELHSKNLSYVHQKNSVDKVINLYDKGGSCPTCLQQLKDEFVVGKLKTNSQELEFKMDELKTIQDELHSKAEKYSDIMKKIREAESQIGTNKHIAMQYVEKAKKIKLALEEAKKEFIDNSDKIKSLNEELHQKIDEKSNLVNEQMSRSIITNILKDNGVKSSIIGKYLPLFNKQINYYLGLLEADYYFTLDEEFSETIKSRGREDFSYASFSQGEKGRIDLALLFTWRDIAEKVSGISISCLFMDEVFDSCLDAQGTKNINTILNKMDNKNVFIISHRDDLNPSDYGQHLQLRKIGRFTVLE